MLLPCLKNEFSVEKLTQNLRSIWRPPDCENCGCKNISSPIEVCGKIAFWLESWLTWLSDIFGWFLIKLKKIYLFCKLCHTMFKIKGLSIMPFADEHGVSTVRPVLPHYVWFFTTKIVTAKTYNLKEASETNGRCHCGYSVLKTQLLDLKPWSNLSTLLFTFPCLSTPPHHRLIPNESNVLNYNISCVF